MADDENVFYSYKKPDIILKDDILEGTNDYCEEDEDEIVSGEGIAKTPLRYQIINWLKKYVLAGVVVLLIGTALVAGFNTVICVKIMQNDLESIHTRLDNIEDDSVDKESLELSLKELENRIKNSIILDFSKMQWDLDQIEETLGVIEQNKD